MQSHDHGENKHERHILSDGLQVCYHEERDLGVFTNSSLKAPAQCAKYKWSIRKILGKEQRTKAKNPTLQPCHFLSLSKNTYIHIITFKYLIKYK